MSSAGRRPYVSPIEFDPRMGFLVGGLMQQADDELALHSLFGKKPVMHQGIDQAAWPVLAQTEHAHDDVAEPDRRDRGSMRLRRFAKTRDDRR